MNCRIGIGYDIHHLVEGRKLIIGGVEIPYIKGLLGHSDADVLLHAVCDALLGAAASLDIGEMFPDTEAKYQGISSVRLLEEVARFVKDKGYKIVNIDTIVLIKEPGLSPFKKQIRENIARILGIRPDDVNIKAKTNQGLGEVGRKEAVASYAVALLNRGD
ncbi:MAG: 2-C-methyl-D-erythritol 2,4-cyclodiphosphate synthase [Candidatus Omnitrophota bacterium]